MKMQRSDLTWNFLQENAVAKLVAALC